MMKAAQHAHQAVEFAKKAAEQRLQQGFSTPPSTRGGSSATEEPVRRLTAFVQRKKEDARLDWQDIKGKFGGSK